MAHYALLDEDNTVLQVIVGPDDTLEEFYKNLYGVHDCKRTSYNTIGGVHREGGTPFRFNYASIGFKYDSTRDGFHPPRPYNSWTLNETTLDWEAPKAMPTDNRFYRWNESTQEWE